MTLQMNTLHLNLIYNKIYKCFKKKFFFAKEDSFFKFTLLRLILNIYFLLIFLYVVFNFFNIFI